MTSATTNRKLGIVRLCRWVMGYALRRWPQLVAVQLTMLLKTGLDVLKPWPMVLLIDYVLKGHVMPPAVRRLVEALPGAPTPLNLIGWSVAATVLIFLLSWMVGLFTAYTHISFGQRMIYDLAADLFAKLQQLSLRFHASKSVGDNIRRVTSDCGCVSVIVKDALMPMVAAVITLAAMFAIMWRISPSLTLLALVVVPWMVLVFRFYAQRMMDRSYAQHEAEGEIYGVVEQSLAALPVVQAFGREESNDLRFRTVANNVLATTLSATRIDLQFKVLMGMATAVGTAAILWLGARQALAGDLTVGLIVLFLAYLGSLYAPLEAIMYASSTVQSAAGSARRVLEILETEQDVKSKPGAPVLSSPRGHVQIENVTFGYNRNQPVLREVSLEARPGEVVALVGSTGAGKTTLAALIPRFFDPWQGRVLVDGHDVSEINLKSLRNHVALVLQESFLFPLSIAENIAYGRSSATFLEIETAARAANAHEFIQRLPAGYQTIVGERGATLSGGERQRISIARAVLKDAPILILDEPTSALDVETERLIFEALEKLMKNRTTFIIAHRLSTVRRANRIAVLKDGTIAESGTHDELLRRGGLYAKSHDIQFGARADAV